MPRTRATLAERVAARYYAAMEEVFIGLGSNLGSRGENLRRAIAALAPHVAVQKKSSVYESVPHGVGQQPLFYNMVVSATTGLTPHDLLKELKQIERNMGRAEDTHNKPRVIDLDILLYGDTVLETSELTIPHARMHERAFVIAPLAYIAPLVMHPRLNMIIADIEDKLGNYFDNVWMVEETV
jgi:2-amino-4-hydroxy-6-hydroxymethyldihydropteridine diphosphokinase